MFSFNLLPGKIKLSWSMGIALVSLMCACLLSPLHAQAQTTQGQNTAAQQPTLQIVAGYDDDMRLNYWTPAWITLSNDGPDFTGTVSVTGYSSASLTGTTVSGLLPWNYNQRVELPHGTQKQINVYVPFYETPQAPRGVIAMLSDLHGKVIDTQKAVPYMIKQSALLLGILSDQSAQSSGFQPLTGGLLPDPSRDIELATLNAGTLPDLSEALGSFDIIVLDNFATNTLTSAQLTALQTWINRGGVLIEVGGAQWQRTLGALPAQLLPVAVSGSGTLPAGTNLLPVGGPTLAEVGNAGKTPTLKQPVEISTATLPTSDDARRQAFSSIETTLAAGDTPLIVQAQQGQGLICYLAFDPTAAPLLGWPGTTALWKGLVVRSLGDQALIPDTIPRYSNGPGGLISRGGLFSVMQPNTAFPVWTLIVLLLGYILILGPLRFFVAMILRGDALDRMRRGKTPRRGGREKARPYKLGGGGRETEQARSYEISRDWTWRIVLSSIAVFSLLTYWIAYSQSGATINSVSVLQLNQGNQFAHVTTFYNVLIPGQSNVQLNVPARVMVQPIITQPFQNDNRILSNETITFVMGQNETTANLQGVGAWTLHPLVAEGDQKLSGGLLSHLSLRGTTLTGTVTNTLSTSLSDAYILLPQGFASIGQLGAGQTQAVNVTLHTPASHNSTLADQIASANHFPVPYFPYAQGAQPRNDFQRHLALLSALSGEGYSYSSCGGPCSTHAIVNTHIITTPPFNGPPLAPLDANDPLLVAGAPATLIGWADQSASMADNVTINGNTPGGTHDNLIQAPLNLDFASSTNLPAGLSPGLLAGQVIDAQGNTVQIISSNVYSVSGGSITFAFALPDESTTQARNFSLNVPFPGPFSGFANASSARVSLYNWSTHTWDLITLENNTFSSADTGTYRSADGHILLQVANPSASTTLLLEKPSMSLQA